MKKIRFLFCLLTALYSVEVIAQFEHKFEFQTANRASIKNEDVKIFYDRFNTYIDKLKDSTQKADSPDPQNMISNFVIFTEEGLVMKDLEFHSVENCKQNILLGKAELGTDKINPWLYVDLESHANLADLESILSFLRERGIEYAFGRDEEYSRLIKKH